MCIEGSWSKTKAYLKPRNSNEDGTDITSQKRAHGKGTLQEKSFVKLIEPITAITKNESWKKNGCETFG